MIGDPLICPCGKRFFPTPTRRDKCRTCDQAEAEAARKADDCIDDETEGVPRYLPTHEQIAEGCEEIRRGWSRATEENARRGVRRDED